MFEFKYLKVVSVYCSMIYGVVVGRYIACGVVEFAILCIPKILTCCLFASKMFAHLF